MMRPLERAARAIVDTLPATVGVEEGVIGIDIALLQELRRGLWHEFWQSPASDGCDSCCEGATHTRRKLASEP